MDGDLDDTRPQRLGVAPHQLAGVAQGATTVAALTYQVADLLTQLGLPSAHLAGNSMGGAIALALAARGRATTVTAFSPIGFWSTPGRIWCDQALRPMHQLGTAIRPALPRLLANPVGRTAVFGLLSGKPWAVDPHTALETATGVLDSAGFHEALDSFRYQGVAPSEVPTTIAWGSRDILLTYRTQSRRARTLLPAARHVTLPGSGHVPTFDDPHGCAAILLDQLRTPTA